MRLFPLNLLMLCAMLSLEACSVKEDRSDCPCWLEVDIRDCHRYADELCLRWHPQDGKVSAENIALGPWQDVVGKEMPRGFVRYCAYSGVSSSRLSGEDLIIPEGCACDSLYLYSAIVDTSEETAEDVVRMHKEYAVISIVFSYGSGMEAEGSRVELSGDWRGVSLNDGTPVRGTFRCEASRSGGNLWSVNVPRQGDSSLRMTVHTGDVHESLLLGEYLEQAGYDWTEANLRDVRLEIDWSSWTLSLEIEPWQAGIVYQIEY